MSGRAGAFGRRTGLLALGGALAGCGFRPLYAPQSSDPEGPQADLATVRIAPMSERSGQLLRQELQARFDHGEALAKHYELTASFGLALDVIGIQTDTSATRLRYVGTSNWSLKTLDPSRAILVSGNARSLDGLNVLDQQYFEVDMAGETVTRRLASSLADQITVQVAAYFAKKQKAGGAA